LRHPITPTRRTPVNPIASPWLVPTSGSPNTGPLPTSAPAEADETALKAELDRLRTEIGRRQRMLFADGRFSMLLVFQALDAAGKDSTIRAVLKGVNPAGCRVHSFKQPSAEELGHDFLWRTSRRLPERGRIGVFNRSYYEEVLVVRVHPEYLASQGLERADPDDPRFWADRMASIRDHEAHLARNGTVVLKFFLNVSKEEQRLRFLRRLDRPDKNWKFSLGDVRERGFWDQYQHAYREMLAATSRDHAPWYAIPADDKPFMRVAVADIILKGMEQMPLRWPPVAEENRAHLGEIREQLMNERPDTSTAGAPR